MGYAKPCHSFKQLCLAMGLNSFASFFPNRFSGLFIFSVSIHDYLALTEIEFSGEEAQWVLICR